MFIRPEEIMMELLRTYKKKTFGLADVVEWCMQVEIDYIGDVDIMYKYEVDVKVEKGKVQLPINIYRILSVTDADGKIIKNKAIGGIYMHGLKDYEGEYIKIIFLGVPIDYDCMPLIAASHKDACKRYVILQLFEEDALLDMNIFRMQQQRWAEFSGVVLRIKQSFRDWTVDAIASLSLHRYNEPFKHVLSCIAERSGHKMVQYDFPADSAKEGLKSRQYDIEQNKRDAMKQYLDIINQKLKEIPYVVSKTFVLGEDGSFVNDIWTIILDGTLEIDSLENAVIMLYMNGNLIIAPAVTTADKIEVDMSGVYEDGNTYTMSVIPANR